MLFLFFIFYSISGMPDSAVKTCQMHVRLWMSLLERFICVLCHFPAALSVVLQPRRMKQGGEGGEGGGD